MSLPYLMQRINQNDVALDETKCKEFKLVRLPDGQVAPNMKVQGQKVSFYFAHAEFSVLCWIRWILFMYEYLDKTRPHEANKRIMEELDRILKMDNAAFKRNDTSEEVVEFMFHTNTSNCDSITCRESRLYAQRYVVDDAKVDNFILWKDGPLVRVNGNNKEHRAVQVFGETVTFDFGSGFYPDDALAVLRDLLVELDMSKTPVVRSLTKCIYIADARAVSIHNYSYDEQERDLPKPNNYDDLLNDNKESCLRESTKDLVCDVELDSDVCIRACSSCVCNEKPP